MSNQHTLATTLVHAAHISGNPAIVEGPLAYALPEVVATLGATYVDNGVPADNSVLVLFNPNTGQHYTLFTTWHNGAPALELATVGATEHTVISWEVDNGVPVEAMQVLECSTWLTHR